MSVIGVVGILASGVGIVAFLPQVVRIWRTGHARDFSLLSFALLATGVVLWFTDGVLIRDAAVIVTNGAIGVLVFLILSFKLRYG
jgi:MtN3 and saliva related transmembrane protein